MRFLRLLPFALCLAAAAAQAETGPCKPDAFGGMTCGEGAGAARLLKDTTSSSKIYAFAWRSTKAPPNAPPRDDDLETVLIRLSDGAVLAKAPGGHWDTGTVHANRSELRAAWSPDSRLAIEITDFRWMTMALRLHAIAADGTVKTLDLKDTMETAARKQLRKIVENEDDYAFSILGSSGGEASRLTVGNDGTIKALFLMQIPKNENRNVVIEGIFKVANRGSELALKEISLRRSRVKPW